MFRRARLTDNARAVIKGCTQQGQTANVGTALVFILSFKSGSIHKYLRHRQSIDLGPICNAIVDIQEGEAITREELIAESSKYSRNAGEKYTGTHHIFSILVERANNNLKDFLKENHIDSDIINKSIRDEFTFRKTGIFKFLAGARHRGTPG
jgi:hypothetical protein